MKLPIKDTSGNSQGELEVNFSVIENHSGEQAVHEVVTAYRAAQRSGTACTKTMGEVAGSGKKPWRQKGTGRARAGSFASPLWRGGGVVFGPKPRDYRKKVGQTVKVLALRKALGERIRSGEVIVLNDFKLNNPKTKEFNQILDKLDLDGTVLLVVGGADQNLTLASRNVPCVEWTTGATLNTYQVLRYDKLVITKEAFAQVEQRLLKD
jgi:large subunit ribosomal protein L4